MSPGGGQREDLLLRQIQAVAAMLARAIGLRISGEIEQARDELERAYGELLDPRTDLFRRVDAMTAAMLLGTRERVAIFAQLVREEAAQELEPTRRAALESRAADLEAEARRSTPFG